MNKQTIMKKRSIETKFWRDGYIQKLNSKEKYLFLYLLLNEHVNIIWIYELTDIQISFETGLVLSDINKIKQKFQRDGKFMFKDNWIKIVNAGKYEFYVGEKNENAINKEMSIIPSHILGYFNTPIDTPIDTPSIGSNININTNININKYNNIENIDEELMNKLADHYGIKLIDVKKTYDAMFLWSKSKGKVYKDYKAGLMSWIQRRIEEKKILIIK